MAIASLSYCFFFFFLSSISRTGSWFFHTSAVNWHLGVGGWIACQTQRLGLSNSTLCVCLIKSTQELLTQNWSDLIWFLSLKDLGSDPLGLDNYAPLEANGICKNFSAFVVTCLEKGQVFFHTLDRQSNARKSQLNMSFCHWQHT